MFNNCSISSLDIDRENLDIGYELLERLEIEELNELRKYFFEKIVDPTIKEAKGSVHPQFCGFKLDKEEFVCAVENVLGECRIVILYLGNMIYLGTTKNTHFLYLHD